MDTLHEVNDRAKAERLAEDMVRNGWQGAPLVMDGETQLITGVHRWHAWTEIAELPRSEVPVIDIREVFTMAGLNYDSLMAGLLADYDWFVALVEAVHELPYELRDRYGIDVE